jgi:hypothetical protein
MMSARRISNKFVAILIFALSASAMLAWVVQPYITEPIKVSSAQLPGKIADALSATGVLVSHDVNGTKQSICEIYWAKATSAAAISHPQTKNGYGSIRQGALVGVIRLLPEATDDYLEDFENQELKPGYYTMRYAVMQAGIGENGPLSGDFVVLSPIALDNDPAKTLTVEDMVRLGKSASHSDEPARIQLVKVEDVGKTLPEVVTDQNGGGTLHFKLKLSPTSESRIEELTMALLVVRPKPDLGGS